MSADTDLDTMAEEFKATQDIAERLVKEDPDLSYMSAIVIAGDLASMARSVGWLTEGNGPEDEDMTFERAMTYVGSYGRIAFLLWGIEDGRVTFEEGARHLRDIWSASDLYAVQYEKVLDLWKEAKRQNDGHPLTDGDGNVPRAGGTIRIYRGQMPDRPLGISWTTSLHTAEKFARGAGTRQGDRKGDIIRAVVPWAKVIAFLNSRNEDEVIIDPADITRPDHRNPRDNGLPHAVGDLVT